MSAGAGASTLAVHRHGEGVPGFYLHGLGGSHRYFEALWEALPPHAVIAPDLLGFGRSPKPRRCAYRLEDHLDALCPLVPDGAVVVGHSAGAVLALSLAARAQVSLRGLVLLGLPAFACPEEALGSIDGIGPLARSTAEGRLAAHAACDLACMARPLWRHVAPRFVPDLPAAVVADTFSHTWRSYSRTLRNVVVDHRGAVDFAAVAVPPLLIHGAGDRSAPLHAVRSLVASRRGARLVVLDDGHHLALGRPAAVARHLAPLVQAPVAGDLLVEEIAR